MITRFYKKSGKNSALLIVKNIDCTLGKGMFVWFSGQKFIVDEVHFCLETCESHIYLCRV